MLCYNCHSFNGFPVAPVITYNDIRCQECIDVMNELYELINKPLMQRIDRPTQEGDTDNELSDDEDA